MTRIRPLWLAVLLGLAAFCFPGKAQALACSATVTDVDFGTPNLLATTNTDALATLTVTCTAIPFLTVVKMCPGIGEGTGGTSGASRLMLGPGGATLSYQLFQDPARTQGWGAVDEPQLGTVPMMTIGNGFSGSGTATLTIYARLFGGQSSAPPGAFASVFSPAHTSFTYSTLFLSSSGSCAGFVGTAVLHPEFDVTARAPAGCSVGTGDMVFPTTGTIATALRADTSLRVTCTNRTSYAIALDNGTAGTGPTARRMTSSLGDTVTYGLYRDNARTQPWGTGSLAVTGAGTGAGQTIPVYGVVPVQPSPRPGTFTDRIVVSVIY